MSGLVDTGVILNMENIEYHQSAIDNQLNLVFQFAYLKDLDDAYTFNISGVDRGKESEQGKRGAEVSSVITYKTTFVVNGQPVKVSLVLGEGVACNTIFSWTFLRTIKASIMTKNNALISVLLG